MSTANGGSVVLTVDVHAKARVIASLIVGGMIALIMLAFSCQGKYGVIEEERITITPIEAVDLPAGYNEDKMMLRQTVLHETVPFDEATYTSALSRMYR